MSAEVAARLEVAARALWPDDPPPGFASGQLWRPQVAFAAAQARPCDPSALAWAALALQLAHEASLAHDDVVDGAEMRRGEPSAVARLGVAGALLHGDRLLTRAYVAAAATGSLAFAQAFAAAVDRTVAGEMRQVGARGRTRDIAAYRAWVRDKTGALFGCALAAPAWLGADPCAPRWQTLGEELGVLYQMLDDFLDYCPGGAGGKPTLRDHARRTWTWPLAWLEEPDPWALPTADVCARFHRGGAHSPAARAWAAWEEEAAALGRRLAEALGATNPVLSVLDAWRDRGRAALALRSDPSPPLRARVPARWDAVLRRHSASFRLAARFLPSPYDGRAARAYAFCRVTDDLVDGAPPGEPLDATAALLDEWIGLARRAYAGQPTGMGELDRTMAEMAAAEVPFAYVEALAEGMRMDLARCRYPTLTDLERYTYRVASVVGMWVAGLFGVRDPERLAAAARMGHAMQLSNIARDVGEDLARGRLYLPLQWLAEAGLTPDDLPRLARGPRPLPAAYVAVVERLLKTAEQAYDAAFPALAAVPPGLGRAGAVAAFVYRGIHDALRRAGYDHFRVRAHTSAATKAQLAVRALWAWRRLRRSRSIRSRVP